MNTFPCLRPGRPRSLSTEPTFIDGMRVLFDERIVLTPADLIVESEAPTASKDEPSERSASHGG